MNWLSEPKNQRIGTLERTPLWMKALAKHNQVEIRYFKGVYPFIIIKEGTNFRAIGSICGVKVTFVPTLTASKGFDKFVKYVNVYEDTL